MGIPFNLVLRVVATSFKSFYCHEFYDCIVATSTCFNLIEVYVARYECLLQKPMEEYWVLFFVVLISKFVQFVTLYLELNGRYLILTILLYLS